MAGLDFSPDPGKGRTLCHSLRALTLAPEQGGGSHSLTAGEHLAQTFGGLDMESPRDRAGILFSDQGTLGRLWNL